MRILMHLVVVLTGLFIVISCDHSKINGDPVAQKVAQKEPDVVPRKPQHPYGGWYCPDNLTGFPPFDIKNLDQMTVVTGRLPTKEETRNGMALMYIDPEETKDARALDIPLPELAWYYSRHTEKYELVIVIQASIIGTDTVVGFRYANGGNGSAWLSEVNFLEEEDIAEIGATPFVFLETDINASKEEIWKAITATDYAIKLGQKFGEPGFFQSDWGPESHVNLNLETNSEKATGVVLNLFGNLYLQIDYQVNGRDYVEKILVMEDENGLPSKLQLVSGPHNEDLKQHQRVWNEWLAEVRKLSEQG